ncbi:MAG TPA: enoyl-CoA hydratase, partial [Flavobacteriales bacterium]|nr:enoyl-CoA hydratase [Flavobacteriales bacterium]
MPDSPILKSLEDGILTLTISRPEALNALNRQVIDALAAAIEAAQDNAEVRVIVLTGAGEKAFVAGADIKEFADFDQAQGEDLARRGQRNLFDRVEQSRKPVVAAINGFALGGGLELAMAAHVRVASTNARMGLPEVSLGVIPGYGGTQRLAQIVGKGKAMEMVLTGGMIPADDALQCGLVNQVVEPELLLETAQILA